MKEDLQTLWVLFVEMLSRFMNNRFRVENDEIIYLRMELEKSRIEQAKLLGYILELANPSVKEEPEDLTDYQPIQQSRHIPWHIKARRLEEESKRKAVELAEEAKLNTARTQTTEEIEEELGISLKGNS